MEGAHAKETYSWYNVAVIAFAAFGSLFSGYGLAVVGPTLGQPTFYSSLNLVADPTLPGYSHTSTIIGAANGVFFAAGFFGTLQSGYCGDKFGRVNSFRIAATIGIIGGIIQTAAVDQAMYLVARVITGLATGHTIAAMPTYYSEVAPPHSRGLMSGMHGAFINVGYTTSAWVGFGCFFAKSSFGWRFPNGVLIMWGICLLLGTLFIPESPRWLCGKGRTEEALAILSRLHHDTNDPEDTFAHRELALIHKQIESDQQAWARDGKWQLFTVPTYRRRIVLGFLLLMGGQNIGILVINNFNVLLYKSLGLNGTASLAVAASWNTTALVANFLGAIFADRLGRRVDLVGGYACCASCFIVATGLIGQYAATPTRALAAAATVFLFLYVVFFGFSIDVNQFIIAGEIFPSHLRSQACSLSISAIFLADVLWLELAPKASETIGWKYYLVFAVLGVAHTIHLYFYLPDTSGMVLEEIDAVFGKEVAGHLSDVDTNDGLFNQSEKGGTTTIEEPAMLKKA